MNGFLKGAMTAPGSSYTQNGALSYASTGSLLVDQFGKAGSYRDRAFSVVCDEQKMLWDENPEAALKFPFYLRLITRQAKTEDGVTEKVQRGAGNRDEAFKRLLWVAYNHPDEFYRNLWLIPIVGSWKDMWQLLHLDITIGNNSLNRDEFYAVISDGLVSGVYTDLVRKYLPRIRSSKKCTTDWAKNTNKLAKEFVAFLNKNIPDGFTVKDYREVKTDGKAHIFQQLITKGRYKDIDFKGIPGKALLNLVTGKFLENHGLTEKYLDWIKAQPVAKFNGYPYELGMKLEKPSYYGREDKSVKALAMKYTVDKQFENLIQTGKKDGGAIKGNVWCALDTSGSMTGTIGNSKVSAYDVCASLGIYFSTLNEGAFHKNVIMFDNTSRILQLKGSFSEMWNQLPVNAMGSTNFQSVIDEIVNVRKRNPNVPLEDYPETLLVVSDMQFNPTANYWGSYTPEEEETNYESAKRKLRSVFPEEFVENFKIVWWNVHGEYGNDMPSTLDHGGTYYFSGFDGSVISLLLGGQQVVDQETGEKRVPTMEETIELALNQEILALVK